MESDQKPQCLAVIGKCWSSEPSPIQGVDGREPSPGSGLEPASSVWAQSWSSAVGPSGRSGGSALGSRSHMLAWAWRREAALLFTPSAGQGPIVSSRPWGWGSALISLGGEGGGCSTSTRQASSAEAWDSPEPLGADRTGVTAQTRSCSVTTVSSSQHPLF